MLLVTAFGASSSVASDKAREASHYYTWGADVVVFSFMLWYMASHAPKGAQGAKEGWWQTNRATLLAGVGCVLMMVDPTRHLLLDQGVGVDVLAMYNMDGSMTAVGNFGMFCTILGMVLMLVGMLWFYQVFVAMSRAIWGDTTS
mmetsp:Transcript_52587/g.94405  ORF Transcript_52587/g.94405 Transcript_52587/m.94405 type:complete len:144 (-) Transcript_52587:144-575(-)